MPHSISQAMRHCIENCTECHNICVETAAHCLLLGGRHVEAEHMRLLQDCAAICRTSADFMLRGSDLHPHVCGVCADVCERCARSCEQFGDDEQMKGCAELCRRCAESCREMAQMRM